MKDLKASIKKVTIRHKRKLSFAILFFILGLAFLLRVNVYLRGDFFYLIDQARDLMLVKEIVISHDLPLIGARSGVGGIFHGPLWLYMLAPSFLLTQGDPFWTLVPIFLLVSLGTVLLGFYVFNRLYGITAGLVISFLLALNPHLLASNLITTNAQVMPIVFILYFWGIIEYLRGKDIFLLLAIFALGIGFHFESAFSVFLIPLTLLATFITKRIPPLKYIVIGLGLFILSVSNFLLFEIRHQFLMTNSVIKLATNKLEPLKGYEKFADIGFRIGDRWHLLQEHFSSFLFQKDQITILISLIIQLLAVGLVLYSFSKKKKLSQDRKEFLFLLFVPVLYFGIYVLYPMPMWSHYILTMDVFAAIFFGLSVAIVLTKPYGKVLSVILGVLLISTTFSWIISNYFSPYIATTDGTYLNQKRVADAVIQDANQKKSGYFEYTNGILTYQMDYLFWYLGNRSKTPISNNKEPITYLVMYPAPGGDKNAHNFWKTNTVRTEGKVIFHRTYPGGIVLEKVAISPNEPPADPNYYQGLLFR